MHAFIEPEIGAFQDCPHVADLINFGDNAPSLDMHYGGLYCPNFYTGDGPWTIGELGDAFGQLQDLRGSAT